ncbi:oligodendrocyte-myelin glycoprotein-like [Kryptolebias marmoratus]|uniref:oligodendrocyte-myelin glycoprotein-like n=1 Tax=Kryptolebias marmoratus TaxID=37003 RepID=UPI0007F90918|nr:oligodendrocyte-myelin glycoprotein-like [Kryptolebias marmoratus]
MRSRPALLKLCPKEALLELVLVLWLGLRVLAVCPPACSCTHSHREVDCSLRGLKQLPHGLQHNIRSLNLSRNQLHDLDGELAAYTHLRKLDLSHNRLSRLPKELPRSLWQLHAASNRIQLLDKNNTAFQWNLKTLDLSNNNLQRAIFINNTLINLRMLNLSCNHFWTLPTNLPTHVETIDLSHNLLMKVLPGSLDRLTKVTHFYLHANRFSSLPFGVLDRMVSLRVITLGNNPWACHLYADMEYLLSWTQHTLTRVLGCPCHTQPVCGGAHPNRTGGWHFASYSDPDLSATASEAVATPWWYLSVSALLSTPQPPHKTSNTGHSTFTATPISISTLTHQTINHQAATAGPNNIDQLISGTKETSPPDSPHPSDSFYFSEKSLITETSEGNGMGLATNQFFTTESPSAQTKRTTTLRTRSVRRQNQSLSGGVRSSGPALPACSLLPLLHNLVLLSLTVF